MTRASGETLDERLAQLDRTPLVRFLTCGSVDDGKSTLIGRLLYESGALLPGPDAILAGPTFEQWLDSAS